MECFNLGGNCCNECTLSQVHLYMGSLETVFSFFETLVIKLGVSCMLSKYSIINKDIYSYRGPEFSSQHPWQVAHNYLYLQLQGPDTIFWALWEPVASVSDMILFFFFLWSSTPSSVFLPFLRSLAWVPDCWEPAHGSRGQEKHGVKSRFLIKAQMFNRKLCL